jgi:zinc transporter ZupT
MALLGGILSFFILEKLVIWRHCHEGDDECATHSRAASLVIFGDAFHTFIDGVIIGAAVLTSAPLGISTALAAAAHEIPQELGDFGVLLHAGYSPRKALILNIASGATGVVGAVTVYAAASQLPAAVPYLLAFAAGGFLYVAMADLIPGLHTHHQARPGPARASRRTARRQSDCRASTPVDTVRGDSARWIEIQRTGARHPVARALIKEGDRTEPAGHAQRRRH